MSRSAIRNYEEFWPFYLSQHSKTLTRRFHLVGLASALILVVTLVIIGAYSWLPAALVLGYGPAWFSHFVIEKNRPATFGHPWWSFLSDFRMAYLTLSGKL